MPVMLRLYLRYSNQVLTTRLIRFSWWIHDAIHPTDTGIEVVFPDGRSQAFSSTMRRGRSGLVFTDALEHTDGACRQSPSACSETKKNLRSGSYHAMQLREAEMTEGEYTVRPWATGADGLEYLTMPRISTQLQHTAPGGGRRKHRACPCTGHAGDWLTREHADGKRRGGSTRLEA